MFGQRAEATAAYLIKKRWGNINDTPSKPSPNKVHDQKINIDGGYNTKSELHCILKKLKKDNHTC